MATSLARQPQQAPQPLTRSRVSAQPTGILGLQRLAGNRAVSRALAPLSATSRPALTLQRCGPIPCDCSQEEREQAAAEPTGGEVDGVQRLAVQRVNPDFEVRGLSPSAASTPGSIFFELNSSAIPASEDPKLAAFASTPPATLTLRGFSSEEETARPALVNARLAAVEARIQAVVHAPVAPGSPTKVPDLAAGRGRLDYRGVRRVEILATGASSSVPNCATGADIDPGPAPNVFTVGRDMAVNTLLPAAITALDHPNAPNTRAALRLFGDAAQAPAVKSGLNRILAHFPNMAPHIPLNDPSASGHRVINGCEGDVLAYNSGTGPGARMTVGPQYANQTPLERGLTLIHEGSHGTAGLATVDRAYSWQRLIDFLPPAAALANADSYTQFVRLINDPTAPGASQHDTASALPAARRQRILGAIAWLEQWLVQGRLEVRSLYGASARATASGAWAADDGWYRDNTMRNVAARFALTAPPAIPSADDQASIAGIFDRLWKLRLALTGSSLDLRPGTPSLWEVGPGTHVTVSPTLLAMARRAQVNTLLDLIVTAATFIEAGRKPAYVSLVRDMAAREPGP